MDHPRRCGRKVYGKKSFAPGVSAAAAIFACQSHTVASSTSISSDVGIGTIRHALDDVTNLVSNLQLDECEPGAKETEAAKPIAKSKSKESQKEPFGKLPEPPSQQVARSVRSKCHASQPLEASQRQWLTPLTEAYEKNTGQIMEIRRWTDILDEEWGLEKIAESSYAEVYKVSNCDGTSVLKIMALRPPTGPGSQRETSVEVASVVSEVLIMNMMAEIPGFLEFKGAHIIEGKPPRAIKGAYGAHAAKHDSFFPSPASYHRGQLFLALELGDAGTDIESFRITTISQIWDIFFGVVIALSHGEKLASFEHRDLHEGNVCVRQIGNLISCAPKQQHKFNYSGLEVTLLDYTLSRATRGDNTVFLNLEETPELFIESKLLQHQMYRRMRNWAFFKSHGTSHPSFDKIKPFLPSTWKDFMPYTNVIWIYYLFTYTINKYEGVTPIADFLKETKQLRERLDPDRRHSNGGFMCAGDILDYCVGRSWIDEEDLVDSDVSSIADSAP